jgi:Sel1 repeat
LVPQSGRPGSSGAEKEVGYFYKSGLGVKRDYAQALTWYRRAAGHGNSDAENQLGWMYQFGQGIEPDDAKALTWYGLAADRGNIHGKNNLQGLTDDLTDPRRGGVAICQFPVSDAAMAQAQRRANIQDLHRRINEVEADALHQDDLVDQLEHNGKGGGITKIINAMGSVGAVKFGIEAENYRAEPARLRDELARIENENNSTLPAP